MINPVSKAKTAISNIPGTKAGCYTLHFKHKPLISGVDNLYDLFDASIENAPTRNRSYLVDLIFTPTD